MRRHALALALLATALSASLRRERSVLGEAAFLVWYAAAALAGDLAAAVGVHGRESSKGGTAGRFGGVGLHWPLSLWVVVWF